MSKQYGVCVDDSLPNTVLQAGQVYELNESGRAFAGGYSGSGDRFEPVDPDKTYAICVEAEGTPLEEGAIYEIRDQADFGVNVGGRCWGHDLFRFIDPHKRYVRCVDAGFGPRHAPPLSEGKFYEVEGTDYDKLKIDGFRWFKDRFKPVKMTPLIENSENNSDTKQRPPTYANSEKSQDRSRDPQNTGDELDEAKLEQSDNLSYLNQELDETKPAVKGVISREMARFTGSINTCPRCGQDHEGLEFTEFERPVEDDRGAFGFWATCPTSGAPILCHELTTRQIVEFVEGD